ncbi:hypothetical protein GCM10009530_78270 [Microbispora corallina]|uniref:Uncharacterized protein n=1 Tax=Microbispora corallina TaxID=83302 RepID=A0ABQ4GCG5_9ACTN|nr:hypothetical protein Mco01_77730 [Microbispora corallina]
MDVATRKPPSVTATRVGTSTSASSRVRTRQFFSAAEPVPLGAGCAGGSATGSREPAGRGGGFCSIRRPLSTVAVLTGRNLSRFF